ncbi:MAG: hypothetical protein PF484_13180 [Bacteroidales bacterium]|jgi:hypothetical protein|nr:hypothetical protein [Bacteroidales bacterium]
MQSLKIPFNESISVEIINAKNQNFLIWCEPAITADQIFRTLNHRLKLLQTMILIVNKEDDNTIYLNYSFDVEIIFVNHQNTVSDIQFYPLKRQEKEQYLSIDRYKYVILAVPGFSNLYSLQINKAKLEMNKKVDFSIEKASVAIEGYNKLTEDEILKSIFAEKDGIGLRSSFPSHYVWYNDLLFLVGKMSFPGYSGSAPIREITNKLILKLEKLGINAIEREAVYQRHFMSNQDLITKEATWYGMENSGKFVQTNSAIKNYVDQLSKK